MNMLYEMCGSYEALGKNVAFKAISFTITENNDLWHRRWGHPSAGVYQNLDKEYELSRKVYHGIGIELCQACCMGKGVVTKPKLSAFVATQPLQLLHVDICGPFAYGSIDGSKYFLTIVDGYSRFVYVKLLKTKSDATNAMKDIIVHAETKFASSGKVFKVGAVRTDNGGEFVNKLLHEFFREKGIEHQLTVPHNSYQNGVAERMHRTLQFKARVMMAAASMPIEFWPEAILTTSYLLNRIPARSIHNDTPFKRWFNAEPGAEHLRCFGCIGYATVPSDLRHGKLSSTAKPCMMLGFDRNHKAYRVFDPESKTIIVSSQVRFDELIYFYESKMLKSTVQLETITSGNVAGGISVGPIISNPDLINIGDRVTKEIDPMDTDATIDAPDDDTESMSDANVEEEPDDNVS